MGESEDRVAETMRERLQDTLETISGKAAVFRVQMQVVRAVESDLSVAAARAAVQCCRALAGVALPERVAAGDTPPKPTLAEAVVAVCEEIVRRCEAIKRHLAACAGRAELLPVARAVSAAMAALTPHESLLCREISDEEIALMGLEAAAEKPPKDARAMARERRQSMMIVRPGQVTAAAQQMVRSAARQERRPLASVFESTYDEYACKWAEGCGLANVPNYAVELGSPALEHPLRPFTMLDPGHFDRVYETHFVGRPHIHLISPGEGSDGPCVVSIRLLRSIPVASGEEAHFLALIRQKRGEKVVNFSEKAKRANDMSPNDIMKAFKKNVSQFSSYSFQVVARDVLQKSMLEYEHKFHVTRMKFGILYVQGDQGAVEDDMYGNVTGNDEFEHFLCNLGTKITLLGWDRYRGGLDTIQNATGEHGVYTEWRGFEIMFHVSTYLPYSKDNPQQVERKRHLGNDIVIIVFHTGDGVFDPSCFRSQFNHAFIVVRPDRSETYVTTGKPTTRYRVSCIYKQELKPWPPQFPSDYVFDDGEFFREFLLTKVLNAELAALRTPQFANSHISVRKNMLESIVELNLVRK